MFLLLWKLFTKYGILIILFACLSVCLFVCLQHNSKTTILMILKFLVSISAVSRQKILVDVLELIDDGEPTKVTLVLVKDFRRNIFY